MAGYPRAHNDQQRLAIQQAYAERNIRPIRRIVELAREGELTADGELVPAFEVKESTARDIGARYAQRLAGVRETPLADARPRDAIEQLRRRLVSATDASLGLVEHKMATKKQAANGEELRQLARAVREIAAIPEPGAGGAPAKTAPGAHVPGKGKVDGATSGGLAGSVIAAASGGRRGIEPTAEDAHALASAAHDVLPDTSTGGYDAARSAAAPVTENASDGDGDGGSEDPGQYVREQIAVGLTAERLSVR